MKLPILAIALAGALLGACTYYETAPGVYSQTAPSSYDRSWSAAVGAMRDEGVTITSEDRNAGVVQGTRNGINIAGQVRQNADRTVRVQFNTSGATDKDPELINRVERAYSRRMGR
jgi:hypothetical protein